MVCQLEVMAKPARANWIHRGSLGATLEAGGVVLASRRLVESLDGKRSKDAFAVAARTAQSGARTPVW
jgi:hypothetical protein